MPRNSGGSSLWNPKRKFFNFFHLGCPHTPCLCGINIYRGYWLKDDYWERIALISFFQILPYNPPNAHRFAFRNVNGGMWSCWRRVYESFRDDDSVDEWRWRLGTLKVASLTLAIQSSIYTTFRRMTEYMTEGLLRVCHSESTIQFLSTNPFYDSLQDNLNRA